MKTKVQRSMRRKVSNAIHAYYTTSGAFGVGGFCWAISNIQESIYRKHGDPALSNALQQLRTEIMDIAVEGPYAYLPHAMMFRNQDEAKALGGHLSEEFKERIRRTWLRCWTETGTILNHDRWQALQSNRKAARAIRQTHKAFAKDAAALATQSEGSTCN